MLKGGVIMDVTKTRKRRRSRKTTAGACAVMALERVLRHSQRRRRGAHGVDQGDSRNLWPGDDSHDGQGRIGHFWKADVLQAREVDFIDER